MRAPRPAPPVAPRRPTTLRLHGDERVDDWYWLRDRDDPAVRAHLEAENAYTEAVLAPLRPLRDRIYEEIRSRVQETDASAPVPDGPWEYFTRTAEGLDYAIHCRRPRGDADPAHEAVLLDENALAAGHDYLAVGVFSVSPDHRLCAYAADTTGGERYTLRFRDLSTGRDLPDVVEDVTYGFAWAGDSRSCFYVRPDAALRPWQVWRHTVGEPATADVLVFQEDDEHFFVTVRRSRSERFVFVETASKTTSEAWFVPADDPGAPPRVVAPREPGHEYHVEHHWDEERGDRFLVVTNAGGAARNFKLVAAPAVDPARQYWTDLVPHRDDVRLEAVDAFARHLVCTERHEGLVRLRVLSVEDGSAHDVAFPDPAYTVWIGPNAQYDTATLRYGYTSLVAPVTDVDHDMDSHASTVVRTQPVLGGYDPADYVSERIWATAGDGTRVPISLVRRRDVPADGRAPGLLYGYGSYEHSVDAAFRSSRLSLLDRGFVFAIAHVRGGGELGREWYEAGRLGRKMNTFTDFLACAQHLVEHGYVHPGRLVARGGSAGGLLMGVVANLRPDLFAGIVAEVPFVDVITTMLDPSLPLTVTEWEEWGDPRDAEAYRWMRAYSPYDNVRTQPYPAMLVTTGLHDPRVQYWEPVKWVAKLRAHTTSGRPILCRVELDAGHGGPSGRYDAWREEATVLAFVCDAAGVS
ncbi:MAG: oligopeptidase B [Acidimicrobiia bacterium]|nr:MAG: oligopeptidase B [Acidimicrobiia bacterium]